MRPLGRGSAIESWRQKNHSQMDPNHKSFRIKDFASRGRTCKMDVKSVLSSSGGHRWPPNRRKKERRKSNDHDSLSLLGRTSNTLI